MGHDADDKRCQPSFHSWLSTCWAQRGNTAGFNVFGKHAVDAQSPRSAKMTFFRRLSSMMDLIILTAREPGLKLKKNKRPSSSGYIPPSWKTRLNLKSILGDAITWEKLKPIQSRASKTLAMRFSLMLWLCRVRLLCSKQDMNHSRMCCSGRLPNAFKSKSRATKSDTGIPSLVPVQGGNWSCTNLLFNSLADKVCSARYCSSCSGKRKRARRITVENSLR
mmetsp:Transcript_18858/g.34613  ORF Transcript_18858/g.34613 Transcript_18858/m.34613 type:complete len:221 (+) Transcript_18858:311-973(+)